MSHTKTQYRVTYRTEYTTKVATKETWLPCSAVLEDPAFAEFVAANMRREVPTLDAAPTEYRVETRTVTTSDWSHDVERVDDLADRCVE